MNNYLLIFCLLIIINLIYDLKITNCNADLRIKLTSLLEVYLLRYILPYFIFKNYSKKNNIPLLMLIMSIISSLSYFKFGFRTSIIIILFLYSLIIKNKNLIILSSILVIILLIKNNDDIKII